MFIKTSSRFLKVGLLSVSFLLWALVLRAQEPAVPAGEKSTLRAIGTPPESASYSVSISQNKSEDVFKVADDIHIAAGEKIEGEILAVMGDIVIDGIVLGDVTAVMGNIKLGPKAVVEGKVNVLAGELQRDRGATVLGKITQEDLFSRLHVPEPLQAWWTHALSHGALLGVGRGLGWLLKLSFAALGFYALLALVFPGGVRRTGEVLVERPAVVLLSAFLTLLALPFFFLLLCVTIIGIPVALLVLPLTIIFAALFGQAAIHGLVGRRVLRERGSLVVAVLVGSLIFAVIYHVPVIGLLAAMMMGALGLGSSVAALLSVKNKTETPAASVAPAAPPFGAAGSVAAEPMATAAVPVSEADFVPPLIGSSSPASALPRAGFWLRMAAMFIDLILVALICGPTGAGAFILPALAAYGAVMWKIKGTTIGGIVCGLRVVRLDDRSLDWSTVVARALGCFVSLVVFALGFLRVAFATDRQSWHDKIAGTVVVRDPKGVSLV